jgi:hypothetical protein
MSINKNISLSLPPALLKMRQPLAHLKTTGQVITYDAAEFQRWAHLNSDKWLAALFANTPRRDLHKNHAQGLIADFLRNYPAFYSDACGFYRVEMVSEFTPF